MFGLGMSEIFLAGLIGLLLFGGNLPRVAGQAAQWLVKLRRSLNELRRESGIDREIDAARREIEQSVGPLTAPTLDVRRAAEETFARPLRDAAIAAEQPDAAPQVPAAPTPPPASEPAKPRDEAAG